MKKETDKSDFLSAMEGVTELSSKSRVASDQKTVQSHRLEQRRENAASFPPEDTIPYGHTVSEFVGPDELIEWKLSGVQPGDFKNLEAGVYVPKSHLDLHHHTVEESRVLIWNFLTDALEQEHRTVQITHGRGMHSNPKATLKSYVVQCLKEDPNVLAFCSAPTNQGGTGSTYVQLRKSETEREQTREQLGLKGSPI